MRALFVSTPGIGHAFPMVPLARALRTAGHDVLMATTGPALAVAQAGFPMVDVTPGFDRIRRQIPRNDPGFLERLRALRRRRLDDLRELAGYLSALSNLLVDGVVKAAAAWRPDVVVHSQVDGAGLVAAGRLGIPLATHGFGFADTAGMAELYREHMAAAFDRHGVTDLPSPRATIDVAPPSMFAGRGWPMRYLPYNGGGSVPDGLCHPADGGRRIAVTLGTLEPARGGLGVVERIVDAVTALDLEVVLALGDVDLSALGTLPPRVRVAGWVPLNALLDSCAAIVHHGGAGTALTALDAGVPQLVLPSGADRYINAAAITSRGVGLRAEAGDVDAALLRRLVEDAALRHATAEVRAEMRAMPGPEKMVDRLAELVG